MEIVIENPMESPPPPPATPPPLQPLTMSPWNAIVTAASTLPATTTSPSMPAVTTMMTITIAENPTATPSYPPPVRFSYRETYANSLAAYCNPYSTTRRAQLRGRPYDDPDGAPSMSVRRVDKSGLLGITEPEAPGTRTGLRPTRLLSGVNSASGMLSPRRLECVGQLDPVPEVPGQVTRANVAPGASNAFPASDIRLEPCEPGTLARPIKSASFDSLESRHTLQNLNRELDGIEFPNLSEVSDYASSFRLQESCDARIRTLGRLSRLAHGTTDENRAGYTETCCNFPFADRAVPQFPGFEETSSLPMTRATATTATTSTTTVAVSAMKETCEKEKDVDGRKKKDHALEEVRAEAEGCEHGPENPLKDGESSARGDEFVDNDGIQTLRVIILSEQL